MVHVRVKDPSIKVSTQIKFFHVALISCIWTVSLSDVQTRNVAINVDQDEDNNIGQMNIPVPIVIRFHGHVPGGVIDEDTIDEVADRLSEVRINLQLNVSSRCSRRN